MENQITNISIKNDVTSQWTKKRKKLLILIGCGVGIGLVVTGVTIGLVYGLQTSDKKIRERMEKYLNEHKTIMPDPGNVNWTATTDSGMITWFNNHINTQNCVNGFVSQAVGSTTEDFLKFSDFKVNNGLGGVFSIYVKGKFNKDSTNPEFVGKTFKETINVKFDLMTGIDLKIVVDIQKKPKQNINFAGVLNNVSYNAANVLLNFHQNGGELEDYPMGLWSDETLNVASKVPLGG